MKHYNNMSKKQKTIFHLVVLSIMALIFIFVDPTDDTTVSTTASLIFTALLIIEIVILVKYNKNKKKTLKMIGPDNTEKQHLFQKTESTATLKKEYVNFYESAPYHHENWLRIFGYKKTLNLDDSFRLEITTNKGVEIDFKDSELLVQINGQLIGKLNDEDLIGHLNSYWNDEEYDVVLVINGINYITRKGNVQVNFYKKIQFEDNPKVKIVETKLTKVDESQGLIESLDKGSYLKVYQDDEKSSRFYVTNQYGHTLGDVKRDVAKLVEEYFDSGFVIVQLKEVINEVDHTDAIVKFYFIQRNV